mmetsp:Transcript_10763/g.26333  ORF Transcript_10763/g.26333 Transcript_10763/m.26333 type:complete len:294 (-) Transcript_10763:296-1177(-)
MCIGFPIQPRTNSNVVQATVVYATPAAVLATVRATAPTRRTSAPRKRNRGPRKPAPKKQKVQKLKKPKRPKTAYNYFQLSERKKVFEGCSGTNVHDEKFARNIGSAWKALSPKERAKFQKMSDLDRERYERENRAYLLQLSGKATPIPEEKIEAAVDVPLSPRTIKQENPTKKAKIEPVDDFTELLRSSDAGVLDIPTCPSPAVNMPGDFNVESLEIEIPEASCSSSSDEHEVSTEDELEIPSLPSPLQFKPIKGLENGGSDLLGFEGNLPTKSIFDTAIDEDTALVNSMFAF